MSEKLGRYRLLSLLATGGMGEVFVARQEGPAGFAKTVVVKRILRHLAGDQGFIDLFLNEARLAAQLQHPNITQVFGLEHEDDTWFIAMEYVHGRSLRLIIDEAKKQGVAVPALIAVRLCSQALQGLHFAHELTDGKGRPLGILHRDVSPENILVSFSGVAKLVDFGIAKAMSRGDTTRVGRPKGKLAYMAPELTVSGAKVDRRADVYGVGVVLHEALTLERPANAPGAIEDLERPRARYPGNAKIPRELDDVIARALEPEAKDRWETANAMSEALERYLTQARLTVLPTDVSTYLGELFGRDAAGANPTVVPFGGGAGAGTAEVALGTAPVLHTDVMASMPTFATEHELRAVSLLEAMAPEPRTIPSAPPPARPGPAARPASPPSKLQAWIIGGVGVATAIVFFGIAIIGVVGNNADAPSDEVDAGLVMPELVLTTEALRQAPRREAPVKRDPPPRRADPVPVEVNRPPVRPPPRRPPSPKTGKVSLRVNPWAEVIYGGRSYGTTPVPPIEAPVGTAVFTLKNSQLGVVRKVPVKVVPGEVVLVKVDLFKKEK